MLWIAAGMAAFVGQVAGAEAAYPGTNGKIVFERKADQFASSSDPWTVSPISPTTARKLVSIRQEAYNFVYSPNGKKIAFDAFVPSGEIVVMNANGSKPKVITAKIDKCMGKSHPTWSPSGKKIAFTCLNSRGFNQHDVWSANADGTGVKQISKTHDALSAAWSPLGDKIAYTSYGGVIYTVPASGGPSKVLSEEAPGGVFGGNWQSVDWAPSGQALVADASGDGIYTVNAVSGATSGDLANNGLEPAFSPDGKRIVYAGIAESSGSRLELWAMDANGANKRRITQGGYARAPSWGPAG